MLQPRVAVRGGRLLGKLVEPGVLLVECLRRHWESERVHRGLLHRHGA